jgi:16S rRNA processing protein RimM
MILKEEVIHIGSIRRPHGKQGEVTCQTVNTLWDDAEARFIILERDNILVPYRVEEWREKNADALIFRLAGIDSEPQAASLTGSEAYMLRSDVNGEAEQMLTWQDLVGYEVRDQEMGVLGSIAHIDESTMNTLATLTDERLIPLHEDFILGLDPEYQEIIMQIPSGLLS